MDTRRIVTVALLVTVGAALDRPNVVLGQELPDTTPPTQDSAVAAPTPAESAPGLPLFVTLGIGYGARTDGCSLCDSPLDDESFTGHLSLGRYLSGGVAIGIDASVWRRTRPGTPGPADSTGAPTGTSLSNTLGNVSLTASYQVWHAFVRVGAGYAWGHQDLEESGEPGEVVVLRASGKGVGYSLGGGVMLPVHPLVGLALFGNWNTGRYDMSTVNGVVARQSRHRYWEIGFGVTLR